MNYLDAGLKAWIRSPFAKACGWSLIHFLWEGVLIALMLAAVLFLCRRASARLRYAVACLALLAMPLALAITVVVSAPGRQPAPRLSPVDVTDAGSLAAVNGAAPAAQLGLKTILPSLPLLWMAGVLIFYVRSAGGWILTRRLRCAGVSAASGDWQARLDGLCRRLRISKPVVLLESCLVDVPVIMGFLRPVVLVPMGLLAGLAADQLESILIHELAHIRRWDYVVNLLQNLVEGLLFYHPAVWWVSGQVRAERENCCDDVVVNLKGDARGYAAALATLEQNRWPAHEAALAATGGSLMKRIRRLLQEPESHRASSAPVFVAALVLTSVGVAVANWQVQPAEPPRPALPMVAPSAVVTTQDMAPVSHVTEQTPARRPVQVVAQTAPPQDPAAARFAAQVSEFERTRQEKAVRGELNTPYQHWLHEDVAYIISDQERTAFQALTTDEEREHFIEQFWLRRDPTPGTPENEMREEHYRRIAYVNQHFSPGSGLPGWKTDRGRIYIVYGPPDEIESHPTGGTYRRPAEEGGGTIDAVPFEQWRYRWIQNVGENVIIEFVDPTRNGEYRMTTDPNEKDASAQAALLNGQGKTGTTVQVMSTAAPNGKAVMISIPLGSYGGHSVAVMSTITTSTRRPVQNFERTVPAGAPLFTHFIQLAPGSYRLNVVLKDTVTKAVNSDQIVFEVK